MPSLFAYANLKDHVDKKLVGMWDSLLTAIDPKKTYKPASNNWATVALTGEARCCVILNNFTLSHF